MPNMHKDDQDLSWVADAAGHARYVRMKTHERERARLTDVDDLAEIVVRMADALVARDLRVV